jgi:hypothetical protein
MGGTELLKPLRDVLSEKEIEGYARQVFVLTDGEVRAARSKCRGSLPSRAVSLCLHVLCLCVRPEVQSAQVMQLCSAKALTVHRSATQRRSSPLLGRHAGAVSSRSAWALLSAGSLSKASVSSRNVSGVRVRAKLSVQHACAT